MTDYVDNLYGTLDQDITCPNCGYRWFAECETFNGWRYELAGPDDAICRRCGAEA